MKSLDAQDLPNASRVEGVKFLLLVSICQVVQPWSKVDKTELWNCILVFTVNFLRSRYCLAG